jgi:uncharacterized damage-inducible protein DinB
MISKAYLRMMSRYNRWQNGEIYAAAGTLSEADRQADRGAFWRSIHGTLSHLYWADRIWLSRFNLVDPPNVPQKASPDFVADWSELKDARRRLDDLMVDWADGYDDGPVRGDLRWFSGSVNREVEMPLTVVLLQIFNHQTHHRGQVHAMLTAAGAGTTDTDVFLMPPDLWPPQTDATRSPT